jgi:hypothetical protein
LFLKIKIKKLSGELAVKKHSYAVANIIPDPCLLFGADIPSPDG